MILYLDAGNSRLKYGLRDGGNWLQRAAIDYADIATLHAVLETSPVKLQRIVACNVAGPQGQQAIEALAARHQQPLRWLTATAATAGVSNHYQTPSQLGADRWAAIIAARQLHQGIALVIMAGTATTLDVLDADGNFHGGLILPGLDLMRHSLAHNAAQLPEASGHFKPIPTNTDDAITSGALDATLGAIDRMVSRVKILGLSRPASADFCCILSGGSAHRLRPHIPHRCIHADYLVLDGLAHWDPITR